MVVAGQLCSVDAGRGGTERKEGAAATQLPLPLESPAELPLLPVDSLVPPLPSLPVDSLVPEPEVSSVVDGEVTTLPEPPVCEFAPSSLPRDWLLPEPEPPPHPATIAVMPRPISASMSGGVLRRGRPPSRVSSRSSTEANVIIALP